MVQLEGTSGLHIARGCNAADPVPAGYVLLFCSARANSFGVHANIMTLVNTKGLAAAAPAWWEAEGASLLAAARLDTSSHAARLGTSCHARPEEQQLVETRCPLPVGLLQRLSWKELRDLKDISEDTFKVRILALIG
jgi:hypothetical protein